MKTGLQAMKNQLRKQRIEHENQSRDEVSTEGYDEHKKAEGAWR